MGERDVRSNPLVCDVLLPAIFTLVIVVCLVQIATCIYQANGQNPAQNTQRTPTISAFAS